MDQATALKTIDIQTLSTNELLNVAVATSVAFEEAIEEAIEDAKCFNQRQRLVLNELRARLTRSGHGRGVPYGYRLGADGLEAIPAEQAVIDAARQLRAEGKPWDAVRDALNARGFRTRRKSLWHDGDMRLLQKALT